MKKLARVELKLKKYGNFQTQIQGSTDCVKLLLPFFYNMMDYKEQFYVVFLSRSNNVQTVSDFSPSYTDTTATAAMKVSEGGRSATVVDIMQILQGAILCNASAMIVAHNHPSGNLQPSLNDKVMTDKLKQAAKLLDIDLLDHIILTSIGHFSFANEGIL
jgi:DNA repair proteins